ncbi:MAG: FMN-binding protein [archaeon YNP-WB-062]|nr:FMN-binding protein [Candidatus Culexarchaeum yellowstonense]
MSPNLNGHRRNFIKGLVSGIILGASILGWAAYRFPKELKIPYSTVTKTTTTTTSTTETITTTHVYTKTLTSTITETLTPTSSSSQQITTTETNENTITVPPEFEPFVRLFPRAASFNPVLDGDKLLYYEVYDVKNVLIGYAFVIKVLTCPDMLKVYGIIDLNYRVVAIDVMPSEEIPKNYVTWWTQQVDSGSFEDQFHDLTVEELHIDKDGGKIHAISGATLSSRAVTEAIREKITAIVSGEGHREVYEPINCLTNIH